MVWYGTNIHSIEYICMHTRVCVLLSSSHTLLLSLPPLQFHQPPWLRFGTLDHIVFIWKYFSCIRATQRGKRKKGGEGEKHTLLCESWRRPWTLPFIPFTSSAESNCQRGQETPGPIVPDPLWSLLRHEKWKACFWSFFSLTHTLSPSLSPDLLSPFCHPLLSFPSEWHPPFTPCALFSIHAK